MGFKKDASLVVSGETGVVFCSDEDERRDSRLRLEVLKIVVEAADEALDSSILISSMSSSTSDVQRRRVKAVLAGGQPRIQIQTYNESRMRKERERERHESKQTKGPFKAGTKEQEFPKKTTGTTIEGRSRGNKLSSDLDKLSHRVRKTRKTNANNNDNDTTKGNDNTMKTLQQEGVQLINSRGIRQRIHCHSFCDQTAYFSVLSS